MATAADLTKIGCYPTISESVGRGGINRPIDVGIVQHLINCAFPGNSTINLFKIDGQADQALADWIAAFQKIEMKMKEPDGRASPTGDTIKALRRKCPGSHIPDLYSDERSILLWTEMKVETMLRLVRLQLSLPGTLSDDGFRHVFKSILHDVAVYDIRWGAYMLATFKWETGHTYLPIDEPDWQDKPYAREQEATDKAGKVYMTPGHYPSGAGATPIKHRYYGRGHSQLTHQRNYRKMGEALGLGDALVLDPERAKEPDLSYRIASLGMRDGMFDEDHPGRGLSYYINGNKCDYKLARQTVNKLAEADRIAKYAIAFEVLMLLSTSGPPKGP